MYVILFFRQFQVKKVKKNISSIDRELSSPKPKPTCPSEFFYFELFSKHFWNSGFCERSSFRDLFLPAALGKVVFGMVLWTIGTACCPCMPKLWADWICLGRVVALWTIGTACCPCMPKLWKVWICLGRDMFGLGRDLALWAIGTACCPCMPKLWAGCLCLGRDMFGLGRDVALWAIGTACWACMPKLWADWLCPGRPGKFIALREGTACACMPEAWADWTGLVCLGRVAALGAGTTGGGGARLVVRDLRLGALDLFNVGTGGGGKFGKPMCLDICAGGGGAGRQGFLCFVCVDVCGFGAGSWIGTVGIDLKSTISISCTCLVFFWALWAGTTSGSEKETDRCLNGLLIMLEFLLLLLLLFCLRLFTVKQIQTLRKNMRPAPVQIKAIPLPRDSSKILLFFVAGSVAF